MDTRKKYRCKDCKAFFAQPTLIDVTDHTGHVDYTTKNCPYCNSIHLIIDPMVNEFTLLKNGKVAVSVWVNPTTKEIYSANKNSFGYNAIQKIGDEFYEKYGHKMKANMSKSRAYFCFSYSARQMNSCGFTLVRRGNQPLW